MNTRCRINRNKIINKKYIRHKYERKVNRTDESTRGSKQNLSNGETFDDVFLITISEEKKYDFKTNGKDKKIELLSDKSTISMRDVKECECDFGCGYDFYMTKFFNSAQKKLLGYKFYYRLVADCISFVCAVSIWGILDSVVIIVSEDNVVSKFLLYTIATLVSSIMTLTFAKFNSSCLCGRNSKVCG